MPLSFVAIWALLTGPSRAIFILLAVSVDDMVLDPRAPRACSPASRRPRGGRATTRGAAG